MNIILIPTLQVAKLILSFYMYIVVTHVIMSWLTNFNIINSRQEIVSMINKFLFAMTEPVLGRIRRFMPGLGGIDLSPLVLFFAVFFLGSLIDQLALHLNPDPSQILTKALSLRAS